jgi:hypothetical protein
MVLSSRLRKQNEVIKVLKSNNLDNPESQDIAWKLDPTYPLPKSTPKTYGISIDPMTKTMGNTNSYQTNSESMDTLMTVLKRNKERVAKGLKPKGANLVL